MNPLLHYIDFGAPENRQPGPLFDAAYWLSNCPDAKAGSNPLVDFFQQGHRASSPHPLFDSQAYLAAHPEVASGPEHPLIHYLREGWVRGFDPHPLFDSRFYLSSNPDVAASNSNPLIHYLRHGAVEGRSPCPLFDPVYYLRMYADVNAAGTDPLIHYIVSGARERRNPHPLFDTAYYLSGCGSLDPDAENPLAHYLRAAASGRQSPHPLFDQDFYLDANGDLIAPGMSPLIHFLENVPNQEFDPNPYFDSLYYLRRYPDVRDSGLNPLIHFVEFGAAEGRDPHPDFDTRYYSEANADVVEDCSSVLVHFLTRGRFEGRLSRPRPPQTVVALRERFAIRPHVQPVSIIVAVHNALADVRRCLSSLLRFTFPPYELILVDDGSTQATRDYLSRFATDQGAVLIRNEVAAGYTVAANQGMRQARGDHMVLLNSDTCVTEYWLDRMIMCADANPKIGMVGPLSNTASWQSIPELSENGDWATNDLPEGYAVEDVGRLVAAYTGRTYPEISFLNGFCLMLKRELVQAIGYFDEENLPGLWRGERLLCARVPPAGRCCRGRHLRVPRAVQELLPRTPKRTDSARGSHASPEARHSLYRARRGTMPA